MTLRVSTSGLHAQGLAALLRHQSQIARTQQQLTTGTRITQAKDDPVAASNAQRLDHVLSMLGEYGRGADQVDNRLRLQEEALADTGSTLSRVRELAIQGNNAPLSDNDRKAIATEIRQLRASLIAIGNRDDGNGRRLFAGTRDGVVPFVDNAGTVSYAGDDGQNRIDIAPEIAIADTDPGSAVFLRVRTGDGTMRATAESTNTGTGVLGSANVGDPIAWNGRSLSVRFTSATDYEVVDGSGAALVPAVAGTWTAGQAIPDSTAGLGVQFRITGAPATGDTFTIERAPTRDVFATLDALADSLEAPTVTPADAARRANALASAIGDIATAEDHMLTLRASTGMRLQELDSAGERRSSEEVTLAGTLSELRDTDFAEAISRLSLQMTALEAAQKSMLRIQGLSLFDKL